MSDRTPGTSRPASTAVRPCRSNHALGPVDVVGVHQRRPLGDPAQPLAAQRRAGPVEDQRADHRADGGGDEDRGQRELALAGEEPGKRQDDLAGQRREEVLQSDERGDADGSHGLDDVEDPAGQAAEVGHEGGRHVPVVPRLQLV